MKVMPPRVIFTNTGRQLTEDVAAQVHDRPLDLQRAAHEEEGARRDEQRLALEALRGDDDVDDPRLVLEREEDEAARRTRALAADDEAGDGGALAVAAAREKVARRAHAVGEERVAQ